MKRYILKNVRKISFALIALILCVFVLFCSYIKTPLFVYAESLDNDFDNTDVMDDLQSSTIGGKPFDIKDYPYDSTGLIKHPGIISVVEYCYSFYANGRGNYGLYIYFYNPQALKIDTDSRANKIQLAVAWQTDENGIVSATEYDEFELQFCSVSDEPNYARLFYKFKVVDREGTDGKTIAERVNSNARRYDISGVELIEEGASNATDYGVGGTYIFTGYAAGYGADENAQSTLSCEVKDLETVQLETHSTFYRTGEYKTNYKHDLTSVYFAVPNYLLEEYGALQKIKADWYEYQTTPIVITSNSEVYNELSPWVGKNIGKMSRDEPLSLYTGYSEKANGAGHYASYDWVYNAYGGNSSTDYIASANTYCERINWLFSTNGSSISEYTLSAQRLQEYVENYDKSNDSGYLSVPSKHINADLFESALSADREEVDYVDGDIHHKRINADAGDLFDMLNYNDSNPGWVSFFAKLFGLAPSDIDQSYTGISPIHIVTDDDMAQTDIAKRLLIDGRDEPLAEFKEFYNKAVSEDKTVVLFRFAQTDYMCLPVIAYNNQTGKNLSGNYGKDTYVVSESVFYDFKIIELTFSRDGKYTVIPVVNDPIDIYNDITLPKVDGGLEWWQILLAILLLILLVVILLSILPHILNLVIWVVCLPFKLICKLFKKRE